MHVKQDLEQNTWTPLKVTHCPVHTCVFYRLFRTITKSGPGVSVVLCIPRCLEWNMLVFFALDIFYSCFVAVAILLINLKSRDLKEI